MADLGKKNKNLVIVALVALAAGLVLGRTLGRETGHEPVQSGTTGTTAQAQVWTCSMHPQIRLPGPGQCPLCGMDLIPVAGDDHGDDLGPRQIRLSGTARQLASVQVAPARRQLAEVEIRLVGKIAVDETRRQYIAAWAPGRIDRLYIDYIGIPVRQGDHMVSLYSPELLTAQQELIQALQAGVRLTLKAAREKLSLLGLQPEQIAEIERHRKVSDHVTIYAPASGVVVEKHLNAGAYVQTGTPIYTIADLSQVWLQLEAYEQDLVWLRYGQQVEFAAEAYPGERFTGRIAFISPVLDESTRTVKVRVNVPNADGRLKPGIFARAVVRARTAAAGRVVDPDLAGKWISPMHPEIVKEGPGFCDVCGMPLVRAESLGYASATAGGELPLMVPASAVLVTGKRAVVYVAIPDREGVFEGRQIELGPRAGEYYMVKGGLQEGEQVVVNGAFKIDSALQILARPSMMNPEAGGPLPGPLHGSQTTPARGAGGDTRAAPAPGHQHRSLPPPAGPASGVVQEGPTASADEPTALDRVLAAPPLFLEQLAELFAAYFEIQQGLSLDDLARSQEGAARFARGLDKVDQAPLADEARAAWTSLAGELRSGSDRIRQTPEIEGARAAFEPLSIALTRVAARFGTGRQTPVHRFHCPMAFGNRGASWLQEAEQTENPYFGSRMYRCGSRQESFATTAGEAGP